MGRRLKDLWGRLLLQSSCAGALRPLHSPMPAG